MSNMQDIPGGFNFSQGTRHRSILFQSNRTTWRSKGMGSILQPTWGLGEGFLEEMVA